MPIYLGNQAVEELIAYCHARNWDRFFTVVDHNTYKALGERTVQSLRQAGWDVGLVNLDPRGLHSDSLAISRVLAAFDGSSCVFVAIGSGTITDLTRFISHRTGNPFISLPTAASVDGYTSTNAPITIGLMKGSIICQSPEAIFADLPTINTAPRRLTASGFADLIGKFLSGADWKLTHLIWGAPFDESIYKRTQSVASSAASSAEGLAASDPAAMATLMEQHFASGMCITDFIDSSPASGGEHHIAHVWEMLFHWQERDGYMHGESVGLASIFESGWYERFRGTSKDEARDLLAYARVPSRETQIASLHRDLPVVADELIKSEPVFLRLADPPVLARVAERILDQWEALQAVAARVPPPQELRSLMAKVGAPVSIDSDILDENQVRLGLDYGPYLRERFSINNIRILFGW
jgi:glycerol-1-phosphate dehydrogenase [NAD(P)+]